MALERSAYRNPLDYIIFKESKTCAGCENKKDLVMMGETYELCSLGKPFGTRCKKYKESK